MEEEIPSASVEEFFDEGYFEREAEGIAAELAQLLASLAATVESFGPFSVCWSHCSHFQHFAMQIGRALFLSQHIGMLLTPLPVMDGMPPIPSEVTEPTVKEKPAAVPVPGSGQVQ